MQDVLSTIAADQDAIVRADPRQPLLVDGGHTWQASAGRSLRDCRGGLGCGLLRT